MKSPQPRESVAHGQHYPYPTLAHAIDALPQIVAQVKGELNDLPCAANCCWTVAGYAASLGFPLKEGMQSVVSCDDQEACCQCLEDCCTALKKVQEGAVSRAAKKGAGESVGEDGTKAIPWNVIVPLVVDLFLQWWKNRK